MSLIDKIISGGQTGADRAALDFAVDHGIPHGGWCPKGRKAEDGSIDWHYQLKETASSDSTQRTEWNVRDSDGTVIFSITAVLTGGSKKTIELARKDGRPCVHLAEQTHGNQADGLLQGFIRQHGIKVLNGAGPRGEQKAGCGRVRGGDARSFPGKAHCVLSWPRRSDNKHSYGKT